MTASARFASSAREHPGEIATRPVVPWFTVLALAVVMAYADGFWILSLRGAVGAIERTDLQSTQLQLMESMGHSGAGSLLAQQASLGLQVRAVGYGSGILLITNLALVGWVVALRGGRLGASRTPVTGRAIRGGSVLRQQGPGGELSRTGPLDAAAHGPDHAD